MKTYSMRTNKEKSLYNSVTPVNSAREYVSRQPRLDAPGPWKLFPIGYFQKRSEARWAEIRLKRSKGRRSKWLTENKVWRAYASESLWLVEPTDRRATCPLYTREESSPPANNLSCEIRRPFHWDALTKKKLAVGSSEWKLMGQPRSSGRFIHC